MNTKRLSLAIVATFAGLFGSDYLIHAVWLTDDYKASASLWRPEAEMGAHMGWLLLAQFLFAAIFVIIWANGFPFTARLGGACLYGACMGLLSETNTLVAYAVQPLPAGIAVKWFFSGVAQGILLGVVAFFVYRPATATSQSAAKRTEG